MPTPGSEGVIDHRRPALAKPPHSSAQEELWLLKHKWQLRIITTLASDGITSVAAGTSDDGCLKNCGHGD